MKYAAAFLVTAESALYFSFAMLIPAFTGFYPAALVFLGIAFLAMILAETLRKIPVLRAVPVLFTLAALMHFPINYSLLIFLPPFLYLLLTAMFGRFRREHWRWVRAGNAMLVFSVVFAVIALVMDPMGKKTLVLTAVCLLCCFFGLRMSRLNSEGSLRWLAYSSAEMLAIPAAGLAGAGFYVLLLHSGKVFEILMMPFALLLSGISGLLVKIFSWMRPFEEEIKETAPETDTLSEATEKAIEALDDPSTPEVYRNLPKIRVNWTLLLVILFVALTALALYLAFRKKNKTEEETEGSVIGGKASRPGRRYRAERRAKAPDARIRQTYREYLMLQYRRGMDRIPGNTSMEILRFSWDEPTEAKEARLRELYIKARYRGLADREEANEAERILKELKNSWAA